MTDFHLTTPDVDSNWRSIILFGRNVASYKFALAKALLDLADEQKTQLTLAELAPAFSRNVCQHLLISDKQATSPSSKFLDSCRKFNKHELSEDQLIQETVRNGFNNVIDAFHIVNQREVDFRFFTDDRKNGGGITLSDDLLQLRTEIQGSSLGQEVESRWNLVEAAWSLNIGRNLIIVEADAAKGKLFVNSQKRIDITSSRDALNGYQKGRCFYCFDEISVSPQNDRLADVDHFFPWVLMREGIAMNLDGVWNLVLACRQCNRGTAGKFAQVPAKSLLERLHRRNNYLIDSHHPLRRTLIKQTGASIPERERFLQRNFDVAIDAFAISNLDQLWKPQPMASAVF
jgi:hypothetical protein